MPVKWVLHWQPTAADEVNAELMNEISQCIESLNGVEEGRWKSVLPCYKPVVRAPRKAAEFPRYFHALSVSEQPNKCYLTVHGQRIVLEADSSIQTILENLKSYKSRVSLIFEGTQYSVGDFQLRVGKVTRRFPSHSETTKEIVMEVEYLPISSIRTSRQILENFVDTWKDILTKRSFPGQFLHIKPNFGEYSLSDYYTSQHTAVQYATFGAHVNTTIESAQGRNLNRFL